MDLCKKREALSDEVFERQNDCHWIWESLVPESKLIIGFFIEQRTLEDFKSSIHEFIGRIRSKPLFTSDEFPHYGTAFVRH